MAKNSENLAILHEHVLLDPGALGADTGAIANGKIDGSRLNGFRVIKSEIAVCWEGKTDGEGPIEVGLMFNEGSGTDVDEIIEADPQSSNDDWADGDTKRPLFKVGVIQPAGVSGELFDGGFKDFVFRWSCPEGEGLRVYGYNHDTGALTTGLKIHFIMKHYGVWLRD